MELLCSHYYYSDYIAIFFEAVERCLDSWSGEKSWQQRGQKYAVTIFTYSELQNGKIWKGPEWDISSHLPAQAAMASPGLNRAAGPSPSTWWQCFPNPPQETKIQLLRDASTQIKLQIRLYARVNSMDFI